MGDVVVGPTGGFQTADGIFVRCPPGATHCFFFRPGPYRQGGPLVTSADLTLWGLGVPAVSLRVNARAGMDLGESDAWPGTDPPIQLLEAYAEYAPNRATLRLGRQFLTNRLGIIGVDGARGVVRSAEARTGGRGLCGVGIGSSHGALRLQLRAQPTGRLSAETATVGCRGRDRLGRQVRQSPVRLSAGSRARVAAVRLGANGSIRGIAAPFAMECDRRSRVRPGEHLVRQRGRDAAVHDPLGHGRCGCTAISASFRSMDHMGCFQSRSIPRHQRTGVAPADCPPRAEGSLGAICLFPSRGRDAAGGCGRRWLAFRSGRFVQSRTRPGPSTWVIARSMVQEHRPTDSREVSAPRRCRF